jgi:hypothetical protein
MLHNKVTNQVKWYSEKGVNIATWLGRKYLGKISFELDLNGFVELICQILMKEYFTAKEP